jgi:hypothetical protein
MTCFHQGTSAEQRFATQARRRGWRLWRASRQQDINEHWDWAMQQQSASHLVDVKARKRINRHDAALQDAWVWIELHSVRPDHRGWLYDGKATLIAFEGTMGYLIVPRLDLIALVGQCVEPRFVTRATEARYCRYQRPGRCDEITLIERTRLFAIAWEVWEWL